MSVKCRDIIAGLEQLAPGYLVEDWDNVGLLVGSPEQTIHKVSVALDVDMAVISEAIAAGADMIVAHHPLIFKKISQLRTDLPLGSMLSALIKHGIAVYTAHTNLDSAPGGVNDVLARKLNLLAIAPLTTVYQEPLHKLAVFVPASHVEQVRMAMTEAGAGHIGNYSHCTFQTQGIGTFLPLAGTAPFIGEQGKLEFVEEYRLETIVAKSRRSEVIAAMLAAHPYEEVAYDEYVLKNSGLRHGLGRVGRLTEPMPLAEFIQKVKTALAVEAIKVAGPADAVINTVAVCGGSGASLIEAASKAGADVLVTGDVKYHDAQQAIAEGMVIIDAGHFATEQPVVESVVRYLTLCAGKKNWNVQIMASNVQQDVFRSY
ncbi:MULTISPECIES: Nif3-like dinuclear metal center hexameric protein [Sporomusa]|uniref:Nif3-like dinuclear metal center hexameric protein n=1 Tax=Sporomusa TaxID=2375 RepID=UPI0031588AE0